jgi:hypothetical protein
MKMNRKNVYTVLKAKVEGKKDFWLKIGTCLENKDGSWNVYLNALPLDGVLNIRDPQPNDNAKDAQA